MITDGDSKQGKRRMFRIMVIVLVIVCLVAIGASVVLYNKYKKSQDTGQAQAKNLVAQLQKIIELPNTTPTVVTVTNKDKLANQTLATRVKDQDMLLIYDADKRIVIYRPSTKKVVDMLSFETQASVPKVQGQDQNQTQSSTKTTPTATPSPSTKP